MSSLLKKNFQFTENALKWFVDAAPGISSDTFVTYIVHNLIYLHQDVVSHYSGLEMISALPIENFLNPIKRKSHQHLAQNKSKKWSLTNIMYRQNETHSCQKLYIQEFFVSFKKVKRYAKLFKRRMAQNKYRFTSRFLL